MQRHDGRSALGPHRGTLRVPARSGRVGYVDPGNPRYDSRRTGADAMPFGFAFMVGINSVTQWTEDQNNDYDYALVTLDRDIGLQSGYMGLQSLTNAAIDGLQIALDGYPADIQSGTVPVRSTDRIRNYDGTMLYYDADTAGGQSGAGVHGLYEYRDRVVGVHGGDGWYWLTHYNRGARITSDRLNLIVSWMTNATPDGALFSSPYDTSDWHVVNRRADQLSQWIAMPGVEVVSGDFDGDHRSDLLLAGVSGWASVPVAFSDGDGSFSITNIANSQLAAWAAEPGARIVAGDFDGDDRTDFAITGASWWNSIPVAFSNGDGSFHYTNHYVPHFPGWAASPGARLASGDFDHDGYMDLAVTGVAGWSSIPAALSNGDGTFRISNDYASDFPGWAAHGSAQVVGGDFDCNGRGELALGGVPGWTTIPSAKPGYVVAGTGQHVWGVSNRSSEFGAVAATAHSMLVSGDFDGDGCSDLAATGGVGWTTLPVAFSRSHGHSYEYRNADVGADFGAWAGQATRAVSGDFNADGRDDVALMGGPGWRSVPIAFHR